MQAVTTKTLKPAEQIQHALAHFFVGMLLSDPDLSETEMKKIDIIIYKMRHGLPGKHELMMDVFKHMRHDDTAMALSPEYHLNRGLELLDSYAAAGLLKDVHLEALMDLLDVIAEVGEVTEEEELYLQQARQAFNDRAEGYIG